MNIWQLTIGEPLPGDPQDNRLYRSGMLARTLARRGHSVTWWTSDFNHQTKRRRSVANEPISIEPNLTLRFLHGPAYGKNVSVRRLINHYFVGRDFVSKAADAVRPDIIISSFPTIELCYEAVKFAKIWNIPCVLDIRDLWPDIFLQVLPNQFRSIGRRLLRILYEKTAFSLQNASAIVGISEGYLEWGLRYAQRSRSGLDAVIPLGYDPLPTETPVIDVRQRWHLPAETFIVLFIGTFGRSYDLDTVIDAAKKLESSGNNSICFVLCGEGEQLARLKEKAKELRSVLFPGWLEKELLQSALRCSHIGLLAYAPGAPQSLPNKLFEYMSAGLPVLSSLYGEASLLIEKENLGLHYIPCDAESLAEKVLMLRDGQIHRRCSERAAKLFNEHFVSTVVYDSYWRLIEQVWAKKQAGSERQFS